MILGIGTDIVDIRRIEASLKKSGAKFEARLFTQNERALAKKRKAGKARAAFYAKRFAGKEAFAKATGTGFGKHLSFQDIEIVSAKSGAPKLTCLATAKKLLKKMSRKKVKVDVSLSDDYPYAQAFVVIWTK
jgi:holo-[acyl-carrier protein] synthase